MVIGDATSRNTVAVTRVCAGTFGVLGELRVHKLPLPVQRQAVGRLLCVRLLLLETKTERIVTSLRSAAESPPWSLERVHLRWVGP